jgi:hypothetical protein
MPEKYISLFDNVSANDLINVYAYSGSLQSVFDRLFQKKVPAAELIYGPTRILKALIDFKITVTGKSQEELLKEALALGIDVYKNHTVNQDRLSSLQKNINAVDSRIMKSAVTQQDDPAACYSSVSSLSIKTTQRIFQKAHASPIVLIPVAHGAMAIGLDIYLRYNNLLGNDNSIIYPCRYSRHKMHDTMPRLSNTEITYIQEMSKNRVVVILEENVATATTTHGILKYFQEHIFPHTQLITETNVKIGGHTSSHKTHDQMIEDFILTVSDK